MDEIPKSVGDDGFVFMINEALSGRLKHYKIRFIVWQALLGVFSVDRNGEIVLDNWISDLEKTRNYYEIKKMKFLVDPHKEEITDALIDNPLSTKSDSVWAKYFENHELKQGILKDVVRTYPELDFFRDESIQQMMINILFIYAKDNSDLGYRQGIHEILAVLVYMLYHERYKIEDYDDNTSAEGEQLRNNENTPFFSDKDYISFDPILGETRRNGILTCLYDKRFLENDLYILFEKIMDRIGVWYHHYSNDLSKHNFKKKSKEIHIDPHLAEKEGALDSTVRNSSFQAASIQERAKYIQGELLKKYDKQLLDYIISISIEPQLYLFRWLKLLFTREFHIENTLLVWDAIFAFSSDFILVDYLSISMLLYIKEFLINHGFADCIYHLQKYPPVDDVNIIIQNAINLARYEIESMTTSSEHPIIFPPKPSHYQSSLPQSSKDVQKNHKSSSNKNSFNLLSSLKLDQKSQYISFKQSSSVGFFESLPPKVKNAFNFKYSASNSSDSGQVANNKISKRYINSSKYVRELQQKVYELESAQWLLAKKLSSALGVLQSEIDLKGLAKCLPEKILLAIADLKKIRDIGYGHVSLSKEELLEYEVLLENNLKNSEGVNHNNNNH